MTLTPEDDWTPVARSARDPAAVIVLPDESFELEDLRQLAQALEDAGLPVLITESTAQRRVIVDPLAVPVIIHVTPVFKDLLVGLAASASWDAIKAAFGRIRRRGKQVESAELTIDLRVETDHLVASARGPATEALAEIARLLVDRPNPTES